MDTAFREQLRTFHLTGGGLEEYAPSGPLHPLGVSDAPSAVPAMPLVLMQGAELAAVRGPAREALRNRARELHRGLVNLLAADDSHAAESPENLTASLGAEATDFFNAGAMALAVQRSTKGPRSLEPGRRARIQQAAAALDGYLVESAKAPLFWLFSEAGGEGVEAIGGRWVQEASQTAGVTFCRQMLAEFKPVLQALRVARLEIESAYLPEQHDEPIARVDWRTAEASEVGALASVVVMGRTLEGLSDAVNGDLPLQLLIPCRDLDGAGLGHVAMAYGQAFVVQETASHAARLLEGLRRMAAFPGPAVAVVAVASDDSASLPQLDLRLKSREFPLFRYDPARGETWAERLQFHHEPPQAHLTAAHAAALAPALHRWFRVLPESAANDDQLEVSEYLARYKDRAPLAVPFVWVGDGNGGRRRAVITRHLAHYCHARRGAYRLLEELAGVGNSFVDAAVAQARTEAEGLAAAREQAAFEKGKQEGTRQAVSQVVAALLNPRSLAAAPRAVQTAAAPAPVSTPVVTAATAPAPQVEEAPADPYIDSFLCTSCNDCMKVNARLFLYNGDKQAYLGDPSVGTFAELVKAAEGCPAKCIHPGKPRPGDASATPAVLARAAKLG